MVGKKWSYLLLNTFMSFVFITPVYAGLLIDSTRVIYPESKNEVTLSLTNNGNQPRLLQTWVDKSESTILPDATDVTFIVSPPLFRLDPGKGQTLRIMLITKNLPKDRESVLWLNLLEVSPKTMEDNNGIKFSVRTKLKIFYRPENLQGDPDDAARNIQWTLIPNNHGYDLECKNASAFNVSIHHIVLTETSQSGMCPAHGKILFPLKSNKFTNNISYTTINDYGGLNEHQSKLNRQQYP